MAAISDSGARLRSLTVDHPDPAFLEAFYRELSLDRTPEVRRGPEVRHHAVIETPTGLKELT